MYHNCLFYYIEILNFNQMLTTDIKKMIILYLPININEIIEGNYRLLNNINKNNINNDNDNEDEINAGYKKLCHDNLAFYECVWLKYISKSLPKKYEEMKFVDFRNICIHTIKLYLCNTTISYVKYKKYEILYNNFKITNKIIDIITNKIYIGNKINYFPKITKLVKKLTYLDQFGNINSRNTKNILMAAAKQGDINIVKLLLFYNSNPNITNNKNKTALIYALINKNFGIAKLLASRRPCGLNNGIDINNGVDINIGDICMPYVSSFEVAKFMIDMKFNVNCLDKMGNTPLALALKSSNTKIVNLLLKNGANIYHKNNNNETILMFASKYCHLEIVKYLINTNNKIFGLGFGYELNNKININEQNINGNTALLETLIRKNHQNRRGRGSKIYFDDIIKFLINNGSDTGLINNNGDNYATLSNKNINTNASAKDEMKMLMINIFNHILK